MEMWRSGQAITAAGLNRMLPLTAWKTDQTSRASTTTATADPDLVIEIPDDALVAYAIEIGLNLTGAALGSGDVKVGLEYSGSLGTNNWMGIGTDTTSVDNANFFGRSIDGNTQPYGVNGGNFSLVHINGLIEPSTAGTLSLLWAQNTSSATATNLRQGSWMRLTPLEPPTP